MQPFKRLSANALLVFVAVATLALGVAPAQAARPAQADTDTPTPSSTPLPTDTPLPSNTPLPTSTAEVIPTEQGSTIISPCMGGPCPTNTPTANPTTTRALIVATYSIPGKGVVPGSDFKLDLELFNQGGKTAYNVIVTIQGDKLIPRGNGGVQAVSQLGAGMGKTVKQTLYASPDLLGQETVTITINVSYSDDSGASYSTPLVLLVNLKNQTTSSGGGYVGATQTPTTAPRSKLIIGSYKTDIEKLQAGNLFKLTLELQNQGNAAARNVTMVLGGASGSSGGDGTPGSGGGVSGGGADLSKFAPVGSSNVYNLGDLPSAGKTTQTLNLVVNVSTDAGVYPLKISFVYDDTKGESLVDDQVITLLVYALPQVTVSFYDAVPDIAVGEFRTLPLQITNTGKKATILGEVTVSATSGTLNKNNATVGTIDTGGYFTMDAEFIPDTPGPVTFTVQIKYTDDFQQAGLIEKTLSANVIDMPVIPDGGGAGEGGGEIPPPVAEESFTDRLWKAVLGFLGLSGG